MDGLHLVSTVREKSLKIEVHESNKHMQQGLRLGVRKITNSLNFHR